MLKTAKYFLADKKLEPERGEAFIRSSPIEFYLAFNLEFPFLSSGTFRSTKYYGWKYDLIKTRLYGSSMCYCTEDLFKEAQAPLGLYTNLLLSGKEPQALFLTKESKVFLSQVVKQQVLA
jgi:succinate-semialdehyde dehydrogenase/glutarate-semialdehyde dehydrogenase